MQASEQQRADRPIQLGPARETVALPTEEEVVRAGRAFGAIDLGDDEQTVAPPVQQEEQPAREAYQPPPCEISVFKPSTGTLEHLMMTPEEEAQLAKWALKPQAYIVEIIAHTSDEEDEDEQRQRLREDALLARKLSIQEEKEADEDYKRANRERKLQRLHQRN